jgi:hypothetical protein
MCAYLEVSISAIKCFIVTCRRISLTQLSISTKEQIACQKQIAGVHIAPEMTHVLKEPELVLPVRESGSGAGLNVLPLTQTFLPDQVILLLQKESLETFRGPFHRPGSRLLLPLAWRVFHR